MLRKARNSIPRFLVNSIGMSGYRDLKVYQLAKIVDGEAFQLTKDFPKSELYSLVDQIRRASSSVVANIAEGYGRRFYLQEYIRFLIFAQASCDETREHLKIAYDRGYLTREKFSSIDDKLDHLGRMFTLLIRKMRVASKRAN